MKKIIVVSLLAAVMFSGSFPAFAQTSTSSTTSLQSLLETLKAQVADLQAKVETQRKATSEVRETAAGVRETLGLIRELRQGMSGDDVKVLQSILAADREVYPEGKISGFFGALTAKAVKRFQKKHGFAQAGNVGPKTLEKLQRELEKNPLAEESVPGEGKRPCAIVPPGHLIAPGWLRKNEKPIVPPCQVLPLGIAKKLGITTSTATSTDSTAPIISGVAATSTASSSVRIIWTTNEPATSKVWYSASSPVQATGTTPMVSSVTLVTSHDLALSALNASTTYYFVVDSSDAAGNRAVGSESSFMTAGL